MGHQRQVSDTYRYGGDEAEYAYHCMIEQRPNKMPPGEIKTADDVVCPSQRGEMRESMEAFIYHFSTSRRNICDRRGT